MTQSQRVPSYEVVTIEDASHAAIKRLRVYVAVRQEDAGEIASIAGDVVGKHAATNDVVIMFFHYSAAVAGKTPAVARAQYVRSGMRQASAPAPLKSDRAVSVVRMPNGVLNVEALRAAPGTHDVAGDAATGGPA
jgi:hypothetical protein